MSGSDNGTEFLENFELNYYWGPFVTLRYLYIHWSPKTFKMLLPCQERMMFKHLRYIGIRLTGLEPKNLLALLTILSYITGDRNEFA